MQKLGIQTIQLTVLNKHRLCLSVWKSRWSLISLLKHKMALKTVMSSPQADDDMQIMFYTELSSYKIFVPLCDKLKTGVPLYSHLGLPVFNSSNKIMIGCSKSRFGDRFAVHLPSSFKDFPSLDTHYVQGIETTKNYHGLITFF